MAPSTPIGSITDELVASLIPTTTPVSKVRRLKDIFNRQLRHHNYGRTNQFEVTGRLDGLQEKFLILNHNDLADALHVRLGELKYAAPSSEKWLPDVLHLLIQLSDKPAQRTKVDDLSSNTTLVEEVPRLRWAEVEIEDPIDRDNKIWEIPDFSDLSSEEDILIALSEPSSPSTLHKGGLANGLFGENAYLVDRDFTGRNDDYLVRNQIRKTNADTEIIITELQAVRETLFMLQGLPTILFRRVDDIIEVNGQFCLSHASFHLLKDILESFASIGLRVYSVRRWLKKPQTVPFMQSLRVGIEEKILDFDSCVSQIQSGLLNPHHSTVISLAKALEEIMERSKLVIQLACFLEQTMVAAADNVACLDLLYTTVCSCQASGADDLLEPLSHLFIKSFEVYFTPVLRWIETGEVDPLENPMFVEKTTQERSFPGLWQHWYKLNYHPTSSRTPRFMQQFVREIFIIGKTKVFLRHLSHSAPNQHPTPGTAIMPGIQSVQLSSLIPFSEAFEAVIKHSIGVVHRSSSAQLREKLAHECGLWRTLGALHSIYLGRLGWALDVIDTRIFDRIDQGNQAWNDRYILTALWRNTVNGIDSIDTERIIVQAGRSTPRDIQTQRRSVGMLESIALTYTLPWPVANIVSDATLQIYKRISTFLFQIRRARYVLERRCRVAIMSERLDLSLNEQRLAQLIHCQLLTFVNYLYDHLTLLTIEHATRKMRQALAMAVDVDGMIEVHQSYISKLEEMCLVSRRVGTVKKAMMLVLDLCIRFSDTVTSPLSRRSSFDAQSFKSAASRLRNRHTRRGSDESSSDEESSDAEGFSTFVTFDESSYEGELSHLKQEFDHQRSFIVAGLRSIGRVEEQSTGWEILAERLAWKTFAR